MANAIRGTSSHALTMNTTICITLIINIIIRSARVCKGEQQNLATAFLDGSQIYGGVRRSQSSCEARHD